MVPTPDYPTRPADSNSTPQRTLCVHAPSHVPSAPLLANIPNGIKRRDAFSTRKVFNRRPVNVKKNIYIHMCRGNLSVFSSLRYLPTPAQRCNFVSIITDVFDSQRKVNTLDENKGGLALRYQPRSTVPVETKVGSKRVYRDHYQTLRSKLRGL